MDLNHDIELFVKHRKRKITDSSEIYKTKRKNIKKRNWWIQMRKFSKEWEVSKGRRFSTLMSRRHKAILLYLQLAGDGLSSGNLSWSDATSEASILVTYQKLTNFSARCCVSSVHYEYRQRRRSVPIDALRWIAQLLQLFLTQAWGTKLITGMDDIQDLSW
jgi:hypothetical protein